MADRKANLVGKEIGPYRLTRLLAAGGFGEVYEAEHRLLQHPRAIKLLLERYFDNSKQRERFLREARTLAGLDHPNILPVLEVDEAGYLLYLVMPLYRRGTFNDLLKQRATPLPLTGVERALTQICAALGYAHARGIAHLDLKPENLLLHEDGRLVLADFGLARLLEQGRLEAGSSMFLGTPYYMAPEQFRGEPEPRSDLYALGVILYQLLTLQRPFTGTTPQALMMKHVLEDPPALQAAYPAAPAALEPVVQKALAKRPADRYQTAEALLADFRAAVGSLVSASAQLPAPAVVPAYRTPMPGPALDEQPTIPSRLNMTQAAGAECEIPLDDGRICGISPVGRCVTCKRIFCTTHQARYTFPQTVTYVDMCAPCLAVQHAENARRWAEGEANDPHKYFMSGEARTALLAAGVQPIEIYRFQVQETRKQGLSGQYHSDQHGAETPIARAWILGEFPWRYDSHSAISGESNVMTEKCLTALLDVAPDDPLLHRFHFSYNGTLARVYAHPSSKEYHAFLSEGNYFNDLFWPEAMQAVKRLIEESS
jgi:tRNA A-37 threonylcarbamoyl transferase component Bud32